MPPPKKHYLFGGPTPWSLSTWTSTDDRIRGGTSTSHLTSHTPASPPHQEHAIFHGQLTTAPLGGAGFASQRTIDLPERVWDLSGYDGLEVEWAEGDGKVYTVVVKDEVEGDRGDGRARSGVVWEKDVRMGGGGGVVRVGWGGFRRTYRGREKGGGEVKRGEVRRVGVMMRSFFGEQEGRFRVVLRSICAVGMEGEGEEDGGGEKEGGGVGEMGGELGEKGAVEGGKKGAQGTEGIRGWGKWLAGMCVVS